MSVFALGSYESFLGGWQFRSAPKPTARQLFGFKVDKTCIKALALSPSFLALGGTSEVISVYDLDKKVQVCTLFDHSGSINALEIRDNLLFSCADDGLLLMYRLSKRKIDLLVSLFVSKPLLSIAVDASKKVVLCASSSSMKVVDIQNQKVAFSTDLPYSPEAILWLNNDSLIAIAHKNQISIYSRDFALLQTLSVPSPLLFRSISSHHSVLVAGTDKGDVWWWNITPSESQKNAITVDPHSFHVHNGRIRGVQHITDGAWEGYVVGFSDGDLHVVTPSGEPVMQLATSVRITTVAAT